MQIDMENIKKLNQRPVETEPTNRRELICKARWRISVSR